MKHRIIIGALAIALIIPVVSAHAEFDSSSFGTVPPAAGIASPEGSVIPETSASRKGWRLIVDRTPPNPEAEAVPCTRKPSKKIVCILDKSLKLSDAKVPGLLDAGLSALLVREARMKPATLVPVHRYTTVNGRSEFSCYHQMVETNCRWVPDNTTIVGPTTYKWVCDTVEAQSHSCVCTARCN